MGETVRPICAVCGLFHVRKEGRTCYRCKSSGRDCLKCGRTFKGNARTCAPCRATERECVGCGVIFTGLNRNCSKCQAKPRTCLKCGRSFEGRWKYCSPCQSTSRNCLQCGRTFVGKDWTCSTCRKASLPENVRRARGLANRNTRRARKRHAQVAGPVSAAEYSKVLASGPCVYCSAAAQHVDHVRPLSRGGAEHARNLVPACSKCNQSKGSRLLTEWRADRVAHAVAISPIVEAEYSRLVRSHPRSPMTRHPL